MIKELVQKLTDPPFLLTTADVWQAYKRLESSKVRGAPIDQQLTEIVSLVRFSLGQDEILEPFGSKVEQRFNLWIGRQKKAGREFTEPQLEWLKLIRNHIVANAEIRSKDLMDMPVFSDRGGLIEAQHLFEAKLLPMLEELEMALVA